MKKRWVAVLLTTVSVVSLAAGCGSSSSSSDDSSSSKEEEQGLWDEIESAGTITVGTETAYAPYAYRDEDGNLTGFDVEVAEAIYGELGLEVEWMDTQWDSLISSLDAEKCDVVMDQIAITDEREKKYIFSDPYTYVYGGLMVNPDSGITSFDDIEGKNCAGTATSNWTELVQGMGGVLVETTGFQDSVQLVEQGRADAVVVENLTELDYLKNQPDSKLQIVDETDDPILSAVMMRQGSEDLQEKINEAIETLREDGTLAEISNKYFGEDVTTKQ